MGLLLLQDLPPGLHGCSRRLHRLNGHDNDGDSKETKLHQQHLPLRLNHPGVLLLSRRVPDSVRQQWGHPQPALIPVCRGKGRICGLHGNSLRVRPTKNFLESIKNFLTATSINDVRSWVGAVAQVSYTFALSLTVEPLRQVCPSWPSCDRQS